MSIKSALKRLCARLTSDSGETIVETLTSVLISALALLLLATAIGTSINIVLRSKEVMEKSYSDETELVSNSVSLTGEKGTYTTDVAITTKSDGSPALKESNALAVFQTDDSSISLYQKKGD